MTFRNNIPNPKHSLGIIRRYFHVLSLLQNRNDIQEWNSNSLADIISLECDEPLSDKVIRDDIAKYIEGGLGLSVATKQGSPRSRLTGEIDDDTLQTLMMVYSGIVVSDMSRELAIGALIREHRDICLWLLARLHFAIAQRKKIQFDYTTAHNEKKTIRICPYHLVHRENKIYLVGQSETEDMAHPYIVSKMKNLLVLDAGFSRSIPPLRELYQYSYSAFIWSDEPAKVRIRYKRDIGPWLRTDFSPLEPEITPNGEWEEMSFLVWDYEAVCRQLFFYGERVEILGPDEVRDTMIDMLTRSMSVYKDRENR